MSKVIRVEEHGFSMGTGGGGLGLLVDEEGSIEMGCVDKWYRNFLNELTTSGRSNQNFNVSSSRNGTLPNLQKYVDQYGRVSSGQDFPGEGGWFSNKLTGKLSEKRRNIKHNFLIPTPLSWDAPGGVGRVFDTSEMRFQRHNLNTLEGKDFGIWNELLVVDIRANGTKDFAYFQVGESGGTAWGVFNVWGNVTLRNASRGALKRGVSIFRATTDDQAIMVNIFGDVTIDGNLSNLIGYVRAYAAVIVHHGATLRFTEGGGNLRGNLFVLGNGRFIQP